MTTVPVIILKNMCLTKKSMQFFLDFHGGQGSLQPFRENIKLFKTQIFLDCFPILCSILPY
jgi:hypothetical protein